MTSFKGTPGPWSIEAPNQSTPHIWIVADDDNGGIAKLETCNYDDGMGERHTDIDHANARLIATAPDLLKELIKITPTHYFSEPASSVEFYAGARNAIKKALGQ